MTSATVLGRGRAFLLSAREHHPVAMAAEARDRARRGGDGSEWPPPLAPSWNQQVKGRSQ